MISVRCILVKIRLLNKGYRHCNVGDEAIQWLIYKKVKKRVWQRPLKEFRVSKKKDPHAGRDCGQGAKGTTEDEMARWHH